MKIDTMETNVLLFAEGESKLTGGQRYMLRRFHPRKIILDSIATIWAVYFMWHHDWVSALGAIVLSAILGSAVAWRMDYEALARTIWGRLAILHLHPANIAIQSVGLIALFYGVWTHDTIWILAGSSLVLLGHWFGWSSLSEAF